MFHRQRHFAFETLETRRVFCAVSIPADLSGEPSEQVVVPVEITETEGVRAAEIEINYDTELLDADSDSVTAGSVWTAGSAQVVASVDDQTGTIVVWVFAAEGLDSDSGSLVEIAFTLSSDAVVGNTSAMDLAEVVVNESEIAIDPQPQPGKDSTDGLITIVGGEGDTGGSGTGSLSGHVYIDSDGDGVRDSRECGVPGVQITLTGSDRSGIAVNRNVLTQGNGSYSFDELSPGTYELAERQPSAMGDGQDSTTVSGATLADDSISNIVLEGGVSAENNFGESGLHIEYISISMFLASSPSPEECVLDSIIRAEEFAGYADLADTIRHGDIRFEEENAVQVASSDSLASTSTDPVLAACTAAATIEVQPTADDPNAAGAIQGDAVEGLVITEINYNPATPTAAELLIHAGFDADDFEFVELANVSNETIGLTELSFTNGIVFDFAESDITTLRSGETLLVVSNQAAFEARYGTDQTVAGQFNGRLNNGGEQLTIVDAVHAAIVDCWYDDEGEWSTEADGGGYTLERAVLGEINNADNWSDGDPGGSPGIVLNWDSLVDAALADGTP